MGHPNANFLKNFKTVIPQTAADKVRASLQLRNNLQEKLPKIPDSIISRFDSIVTYNKKQFDK